MIAWAIWSVESDSWLNRRIRNQVWIKWILIRFNRLTMKSIEKTSKNRQKTRKKTTIIKKYLWKTLKMSQMQTPIKWLSQVNKLRGISYKKTIEKWLRRILGFLQIMKLKMRRPILRPKLSTFNSCIGFQIRESNWSRRLANAMDSTESRIRLFLRWRASWAEATCWISSWILTGLAPKANKGS